MDTIKKVAADQLLLIGILSVLLFLDGMGSEILILILQLPKREERGNSI